MANGDQIRKCPTCASESTGSYCSNCGEKIIPNKIGIRTFFSEIMSETLSFETPVLNTIKQLFIRPGKVAACYIAGSRKIFAKPFAFFFLLVGVHFVLSSWLIDPVEVIKMMNQVLQDSLQGLQGIAPDQDLSQMTSDANIAQEKMKELNFLIVPIIAFFSWVFFRKSGYNYLENIVLFLYLNGLTIFFSIISVLLTLISIKSLFYFGSLVSLATLVYTVWGLVQFHNQKTVLGVAKAIAVYIISMTLFSYTFQFLYNLTGFNY